MLIKAVSFKLGGDIDRNSCERVLSNIESNWSEDSKRDPLLYVNSPGGDLSSAFDFYDRVRRLCGEKLITWSLDRASSAALIIFLAGGLRAVCKRTIIHLHRFTVYLDGKSCPASESIREETKYANLVSLRSGGGLTPAGVIEMMEKNTHITADQAVQFGLAHHVIDK